MPLLLVLLLLGVRSTVCVPGSCWGLCFKLAPPVGRCFQAGHIVVDACRQLTQACNNRLGSPASNGWCAQQNSKLATPPITPTVAPRPTSCSAMHMQQRNNLDSNDG
jgi:hypothetical protein